MKRWEALCLRCGLCCYEKTMESNRVIYHMDFPCRDLDEQTLTCRIYNTRFRENSDCRRMTILKAMCASYLPESCGYVQWARRYHIRFARRFPIMYSPHCSHDKAGKTSGKS